MQIVGQRSYVRLVVWVQADDIQNEAKELARVRAYVYAQVAKKTGQSVEKVRKQFFQALALCLLQCSIFSHLLEASSH
jgi:uncharacterized protein YdbL (DUF1318 family)